ncbi:MAG: BatA domain-containing protein [Tahibacter sp.]
MNLVLLTPLALLGFAALLLPVLLHLSRRQEHRVTPFAALRWLAGPAFARRRLRVIRPWLLLLRLLLLASCIALLAQPVLRGDWRGARPWVVVVPGADLAAARARLPGDAARWHWLTAGFPEIDKSINSEPQATASLLRELDTELPPDTHLSIVAPARLGGLDGERIRLTRTLEWIILPATAASPMPAPTSTPLRVAIRYDASGEPGLRFARAVVAAWNALDPDHYVADIQTVEHPVGADSTWLWWLADDIPPAVDAWINAGGIALTTPARPDTQAQTVWSDAEGNPLATETLRGRGRRIALSVPLTPITLPAVFDANFPQRVMSLLRGAAPAPVQAYAEQSLSSDGARRATSTPFRLDDSLIALIALLFALERGIAMRPVRSVA